MLSTQSNTTLRQSWLNLARAVWAILSVFSLVVFLFALPARYAQFLSPEDEIRDGLTRLGYAEQYIEQYGSEAAAKEAVSPLGLTPTGYANLFFGLEILVAFVYLAVGLFIAWRKFDDLFGLFASLFLIVYGIGGSSYLLLPLIVQNSAGFLFGGLVTTLAYVLMPIFFYTFPDGHWVPRWGWIPAVFWAFTTVLWNLVPRSPLNPTNWPLWLFSIDLLFIWGSAIVAQIYRYRKISLPAQRQQTKWLVSGFGLLVGLLLIPAILAWLVFPSFATETFYSLIIPIQVVLMGIIPITLGISILRYRLWDIDILIRRTLIYSILTVMLALFYLGAVVVLQQVLRPIIGADSDLAIIVSTLAIAALFNPLRHRVQGAIDHRFYRRKYDAHHVLARFAATARDEVELAKLTGELLNVVNETMQPTSASLWLKPTKDERRRTAA